MELPKVSTPIVELTLPSSGKVVRARPFLVKEEKLLLMAAESKDLNEIVATTKQVINNCLVDNDVNINTLPFFDIDYLFIALRAKSIGENIEMNFTCNNIVNGNKCGGVFPVLLDIQKIVVNMPEVSEKVFITDTVGVKFKYPTYSAMKTLPTDDVYQRNIRTIYASVDYVFDGDKVYSSKDMSFEDFEKFVSDFTQENYSKLEKWIENFPSFHIEKQQACIKCGFNHNIKYKDFTSFF